jgi:hypothetical protein
MTTFHEKDEKMKIGCDDGICQAGAASTRPGGIAGNSEDMQ